MMCSTTQKIKQYDGKICSVRGKFKMTTTVGQVDTPTKYPHLEGVAMGNDDAKPELLIHLTDWEQVSTPGSKPIQSQGLEKLESRSQS